MHSRAVIAGNRLSLSGVTKVFESRGAPIQAIGPIDLSIAAGEFVAILGPSGCGKSTLLRMAAGLLEPSRGTVLLNDQPVTEPLTDIGIMFQNETLVPWRTVRGNIALQLELRGLRVSDHAATIDSLLRAVDLEEASARYPHELSGGMEQRAALCQAMVHQPRLLLLDEPLGKLDAMTRERIRRDLQTRWLRAGPTVLFVTHSIDEAIQLSERVAIISPRPGRIQRVLDIGLPYPRTHSVRDSAEYIAYFREIQDIFLEYGLV
ncbi:MAG: ABC transporter ATP-binding protein [Pseudomonadota bacterium]